MKVKDPVLEYAVKKYESQRTLSTSLQLEKVEEEVQKETRDYDEIKAQQMKYLAIEF